MPIAQTECPIAVYDQSVSLASRSKRDKHPQTWNWVRSAHRPTTRKTGTRSNAANQKTYIGFVRHGTLKPGRCLDADEQTGGFRVYPATRQQHKGKTEIEIR